MSRSHSLHIPEENGLVHTAGADKSGVQDIDDVGG